MTRDRKPLPATVESLSQRIEDWRRSRSKLGRMPEDLWLEAAVLARQHGVTRVSRALRVDFASLKKRAESTSSCSSSALQVESGFVELALSRSSEVAELPDAVVSLSRMDGSRLVVELRHTQRCAPAPVEVDSSPLRMRLPELGPVELRQVRRTAEEATWNGLVEAHHYLRYTQPVGEHLKYLAWARDRPVACLAFSSAPRHLGPRDRFIGWSAKARRENIRYLAYNTRFLILPWIEVPYLASHLLGRVAREIAADWERLYRHRVVYLETFIDPSRFRGTCYRAANWITLGLTTGRGKDDQTHRANRPLKEILGYPLTPRFRELLGGVA